MDYVTFFSLPENPSLRDLKRAYAKKIRISSPEKNPEEFKLLREHYEYAQKAIAGHLEDSSLHEPTDDHVSTYPADSHEDSPSSQHYNTPDKKDSSTDEIIRQLNNGLEPQAIRYLELMQENGDLFDLDISQSLQNKTIDYLLNIPEDKKWPASFVTFFSNTLDLVEQSETNTSLEHVVAVFRKRNIMAHNDWNSDDYQRHMTADESAFNIMMDVRQHWFDHDTQSAMDCLDHYIEESLSSDVLVKHYMCKRFYQDLDDYFSGMLPLSLAEKYEELFDLSGKDYPVSDDTMTAYHQRYIARKKAAQRRHQIWFDYFDIQPSIESRAMAFMLGFISIEDVREDALKIADTLESSIQTLEKNDFYYFELGGDDRIRWLEQWIKSVREGDLCAYHAEHNMQDLRLNPISYLADIKDIWKNIYFIATLLICIAQVANVIQKEIDSGGNWTDIARICGFAMAVPTAAWLLYYIHCVYRSRLEIIVIRIRSKLRYGKTQYLDFGLIAVASIIICSLPPSPSSAAVLVSIGLFFVLRFSLRFFIVALLNAFFATIIVKEAMDQLELVNPFYTALLCMTGISMLTLKLQDYIAEKRKLAPPNAKSRFVYFLCLYAVMVLVIVKIQ